MYHQIYASVRGLHNVTLRGFCLLYENKIGSRRFHTQREVFVGVPCACNNRIDELRPTR